MHRFTTSRVEIATGIQFGVAPFSETVKVYPNRSEASPSDSPQDVTKTRDQGRFVLRFLGH